MKKAVKLLAALDIAFLLLLSISGSLSGWLGDLVYILAFGVPLFLGTLAARKLRREREEEKGVAEAELLRFGMTGDGIKAFLPLTVPTVAVVFAVAWLTSLLLGALGYSGSTVEDAPLWQMLLIHALTPAVLEELLFRYLPIKLLYPYSPRGCVLISSLYFALIHLDLFKMPYAFVAGALLVTVDLMTGSYLPSLIVHFLNNAASVLLMKYGESGSFTAIYFAILGALSAVCAVFIIVRRRDYRAKLGRVLERGRSEYDYSPLMLSLLCVGVAVLDLVGAGA